jgi:HPt (histidine-containing phosphotransfer) domain-containing protein
VACEINSGPTPFDSTLFDMIQVLLPADRLYVHLEELDRQCVELAELTPASPGLQEKAHTIVSQAGMFGLMRMSDCARGLEEACRMGADRAAALSRFGETLRDIQLYAMPAVAQPPPTRKSAGGSA